MLKSKKIKVKNMAKSVFRIDLSEEEFENFDKLNFLDLKNRFKKIVVSEKKINSIKNASIEKTKKAYKKYLRACLELIKQNIEITYYNLKKLNGTNLSTHKKFEEIMKIDLKRIEKIKNIYGKANREVVYEDGLIGWYVPFFGEKIEDFMDRKNFDNVDLLDYYEDFLEKKNLEKSEEDYELVDYDY